MTLCELVTYLGLKFLCPSVGLSELLLCSVYHTRIRAHCLSFIYALDAHTRKKWIIGIITGQPLFTQYQQYLASGSSPLQLDKP